ncbi:thiamine phosphate synthase [Nitriliruptoraceae bacterium ZYF776]|nr:thiamine phosphate synthase [Profundirhabdus halotolerans]
MPAWRVPRVHVLTDPGADRDVLEVVDAVLAAGGRLVQVRAKAATDRDLLALSEAVVARCRPVGAVCLVDDRVDVALAAGADGVHLGADDLPVAAARELLGADRLVGGTARDVPTAQRLVAEGVDYLGVGPTFATATKTGLPEPLGVDHVASVAAAVDVPVVAIAGLDARRAAQVVAAGVHGVAVIGAVSRAADPRAVTSALLAAVGGGP